MYKVTKATIIQNGIVRMSYGLDEVVEDNGLDRIRNEVKERYGMSVLEGIEVDLQYREI